MTDQEFGRPHPNAPPQFRQFAFLIGEWRFTATARSPDGQTFAFVGEWLGTFILDGRVIADEFRMRDIDGTLIMLGMNFRQYDASRDRWVMRWLDATAARWLELGPDQLGGVHVSDAGITFKVEFAPGELHRITFRDIDANRFTWQADRSMDGGKTWEDEIMTIEATRTAGP